jgi:hypothetical protein
MQVCGGTGDPNCRVRSPGIVPYRRGHAAHPDVKLLVIDRKPAFSGECEIRLQLVRLDDRLRGVWFESLEIRPQLVLFEICE